MYLILKLNKHIKDIKKIFIRKTKNTAPDTFISGGVTHVRLVEEQILIDLVGNLPN
jgi:hypothetical protein